MCGNIIGLKARRLRKTLHIHRRYEDMELSNFRNLA